MTTISRRRFLVTAALSLAATRLHAQRGARPQVTLELSTEAIGPHMPADFVGLSYEVQQLADPSFFAASNIGLIRQFNACLLYTSPNCKLREIPSAFEGFVSESVRIGRRVLTTHCLSQHFILASLIDQQTICLALFEHPLEGDLR